jgi:hypothetical protein
LGANRYREVIVPANCCSNARGEMGCVFRLRIAFAERFDDEVSGFAHLDLDVEL